jgi:hypothetical protein
MTLAEIGNVLNQICENFVEIIRGYAEQNILTWRVISSSYKAKWALHGILVSAFTEAGWRASLWPVVEPKIALSRPLNPSNFSQYLRGKSSRHQTRLDVGFYRQGQLDIFAECNTIDMANEWESSQGKRHITKRDLYLYFAEYAKPKASGLIICIVLPQKVTGKPPWPWREKYGEDYFKALKPKWEELTNLLRRHIYAQLVVLNENGVQINGSFHPISIS